MKPAEEVTCCVVDYGSFLSVAEKFAETMLKVYYYSPYEQEFLDVRDCTKGDGLDYVERLDHPLDPDKLAEIDLFVFPDIGFMGLQKHLCSLGKAVWGSFDACDLELYRTMFLDVLKEVGLPVAPSKAITGLSNLARYLKEHPRQWIKVDRFRRNMETWHHKEWDGLTERTVDSLAVIFGPIKESINFVVQDEIECDVEIGYDGWSIDGQFPSQSFQGYEKKNELYLGSLLDADDLPDELVTVNDAMAPLLREYGYRNWWATEVRVCDGVPYFIDPTARMAGQTVEHQLETCTNLAEVVWRGANGIMIEPEFQWKFAAEATLHYDQATKDAAIPDEWKTLDIPASVLQWLKLYHYSKVDGLYHFAPHKTDEVGVVIGVGNSVQESIDDLKAHLDELKDLPLHAEVSGFAELLESIAEAEKQGVKFGGKIPKPASVL